MKDFIYSEKFDDYLKGKLSKNEKIALEDDLHQDPLLKSELKLQQEIYHSLGDARRSYLKNRLNQISVNTTPWYEFTGIQVAAVVSSFLFIAGGAYYYLNQDTVEPQPSISSVELKVSDNNLTIPLDNIKPELSVDTYSDQQPEDESLTASTDMVLPENKSEQGSETSLVNNESKANELPDFVRPDVLSSFKEDSQNINYDDFEVPDKQLFEAKESTTSEVQIENLLNSKYKFHYQLYNNKLYLHGDFQEIPYKVIALNQKESKKLFLEYNGDYYLLKLNQEEIIPLEVISDSTVINALNKISQ